MFRTFRKDTSGNFSILMGVTLVVLLMGVGVALDTAKLVSAKNKTADIADATALATAIAATQDDDNRQERGVDYYTHAISIANDVNFRDDVQLDFDDTAQEVTAFVTADVNYDFMGIFGYNGSAVTSTATANYGSSDEKTQPTSIVFVLDVSGSMDEIMSGIRRIQVLQNTLQSYFADLDDRHEDEPDLPNAVRTGMTAYNWGIQNEFTIPLGHGWSHTAARVGHLWLGSGTIPPQALEEGYQMIVEGRSAEGGQSRREIIVFMTDSEIDDHLAENGENFTQDTLDACQQAKADGVEVFAIGMAAPNEGENVLRQCASPNGSEEGYTEALQNIDNNCQYNQQDCAANKSAYFANANSAVSFQNIIKQLDPKLIENDVEVRLTR